jgi:predicted acyltransferase (DUF342 family)
MHRRSSQITAAAYRALDGVSELMSTTETLRANDSVVLVGDEASLDSMAFVNFIVLFEEELERELGRRVSVTEILNTVGESDSSPLTLGRVVTLLTERLE